MAKRLVQCVNCDSHFWSQHAYRLYYCSKQCYAEMVFWYDNYMKIVEEEQQDREDQKGSKG